jgi:cell wall assembly regulator SMI1
VLYVKRNALIIGSALTVAGAVILAVCAPSALRSFFYPKAGPLPPVVALSSEQLLARLQLALEANAPTVAQSLQPGLSDARITELQAQGGFVLSADLKALYRWHDGTTTNSALGLIPGIRFLPLNEVVEERALLRQQMTNATSFQRAAFTAFTRHRKNWIHVLDDGAGDGYFYDPERADSDGAFFYHFAEDGSYTWFPSIRNFLSGVVECYETKAFKVSTDGSEFIEDSEQVERIWARLAKSSESGR